MTVCRNTIVFFSIGMAFLSNSVLFSCRKKAEPALATLPDSLYLQRGDSISAATFDTLSKTLRNIIQRANPDSAVRFCSVEAYSITSMYQSKGIQVRRTSLKFRNPANQPDILEYSILNEIQTRKQAGLELKSTIHHDKDGAVHYFKPILIQGLCITCHGDPATDIPEPVKQTLASFYPNDMATGYQIGDLRGIWHIRFDP